MNGASRRGAPVFEFLPAKAPDESLEFPGATELVNAGKALARSAVSTKTPRSVMVFGWPGTGKTLFPKYLHAELNRSDFPYCLLQIHCAKIPCASEEELRDALTRIDTLASAEETYPLILAIDEAQLLGPVTGGLGQLYTWLLSYLRSDLPSVGGLVFLITSSPELLDPTLEAEAAFQAFMPLPDFTAATALLRDAGLKNAEEVTRELWRLAEGSGIRITGRALIDAANYARVLFGDAKAKPEVVAEALVAVCARLSDADFEAYLKLHHEQLRMSEEFLDLWGTRFSRKRDAEASALTEV